MARMPAKEFLRWYRRALAYRIIHVGAQGFDELSAQSADSHRALRSSASHGGCRYVHHHHD